jgi:hypothetical protein
MIEMGHRMCCRRQLPLTWRPDGEGLVFAATLGVDVLVQWPRFRDHHRAARSRMVDWSAAWRCWCRQVGRAAAAPAPMQSDLRWRAA